MNKMRKNALGTLRTYNIKLLMGRRNNGHTNYAFQGTKFYIGIGLETKKAITACSISPNATITATGHGVKAGDCIKISGLGALDGYYPVKSVQTDVITLADEVDWSTQDKPTNFGQAQLEKVQWSSNFCAIKNIEKDGDTLTEEDVTTMCSEEQKPNRAILSSATSNSLSSGRLPPQCKRIYARSSTAKKRSPI